MNQRVLSRFADVVCVLHCFQKKTQRTSKRDIDLVTKRFKALMQERKP
ncbi:type II toxin-antitoxin system RelE/ParE family toxin [Spectribacter hydrogenoxidans]